MLKTQRLLVPVDFSPSSKLALEQGAALANSQDAELDVLHVWELPAFVAASEVAEDAGLAPAILDSISKNAYSLTERFAAEARDNGVAIHRARALAGASVYETIIEQADRGGYDMIVIGSHGRSGWSRLVIGSVAERVVRHAHCPVLVARAQPVAVA
ncbi:MAG: universal stress protein, partial [Polyangiales bacterium]